MKLAVLSLVLAGASAFTSAPTRSFAPRAIVCMAKEESEGASDEKEDEEKSKGPKAEGVSKKESYTCISKDKVLSEPNTIEFAKMWDPLGFTVFGSDETTSWFRHSEVKHGRIAMAAFVGWWATGAGLRFPGELSHGLDFASIPSKGLEAWDAVPGWGKAQMLLFAGLIEFHDEIFYAKKSEDGHYLRGGTPGKNMVPGLYDPLNLWSKRSEEAKARGRDVEIKNGRLAMIGVAGMYFASIIPGSVPFQPEC